VDELDPRWRAKPGLPHDSGSGAAASDVASCFALGTLVLLEDRSYVEVQNLAEKMVHTTDGYSALVLRVYQFHISEAANPANCLWNVQSNILSSSHYVRYLEDSDPITKIFNDATVW